MSATLAEAHNPSFTAALIVTVRLRPGVETKFSSWHARMSTAPASTAGFVSAEVNAPAPGELEWRVVQRFRNVSDLRAWRASDLHARLFREASELVPMIVDRIHLGLVGAAQLAAQLHVVRWIGEHQIGAPLGQGPHALHAIAFDHLIQFQRCHLPARCYQQWDSH